MNMGNPQYVYARRIVEEARRRRPGRMPEWLRRNREAYRDRLFAIARRSYEESGQWFLARGAERGWEETESYGVWVDLLYFCPLEGLPGYSEENRRKAVEFWQSWQNRRTGRLYNPLYQDPQNPEVKRHTPGNRPGYDPERTINFKYVPNILSVLGAELPIPLPGINTQAVADAGTDTFDRLWASLAEWSSAHGGAFPIQTAYEVDAGRLDRIPHTEAGMAALVRGYRRDTGMWRPEPLEGFPWREYQPSSGFKVVSRICGYAGLENFPREILERAVDNLIEHRRELHDHPAMARNYGETMAHYVAISGYRIEEQLDAMEECLEGFRDPAWWADIGSGCYCIFGSGMIGAFLNWEDLVFDQALREWQRFVHGCDMKWRFVADPYGHWVNTMPKEPEAVWGHPDFDVSRHSLRARNRLHWAKKVTGILPQQDVRLAVDGNGKGEGVWSFALSADQARRCPAPYLKATWSGACDVSLNGVAVKSVRYNLPDTHAGWYVPPQAAATLRPGENAVRVAVVGPGKETSPGAPSSARAPFVRLGLIDWS